MWRCNMGLHNYALVSRTSTKLENLLGPVGWGWELRWRCIRCQKEKVQYKL